MYCIAQFKIIMPVGVMYAVDYINFCKYSILKVGALHSTCTSRCGLRLLLYMTSYKKTVFWQMVNSWNVVHCFLFGFSTY